MAKKRICFAASSGGHFEQLSMLKPLMEDYDSFIITEKTLYKAAIKGQKMYYLHQINRKAITFPFWMLVNIFKSVKIVLSEKPDIRITTGVLAMIPICLIAKKRGARLIYIESFAKITSPTLTGKFLYNKADQFYVQWESMKKFYPDSICLGGIY